LCILLQTICTNMLAGQEEVTIQEDNWLSGDDFYIC
jgi:hypothetical protein